MLSASTPALKNLPLPFCVSLWRKSLCMSAAMTRTAHAYRTLIFITHSLARYQAILLPITTDTQDTALTIFSTLNDRGLQLSDANIFKAKIYGQLSTEKKA